MNRFALLVAATPLALFTGCTLEQHEATEAAASGIITTVIDYYVSTTGSDTNNGLTSGTAWRTLGHAASSVAVNSTTNAIVHIASGTYDPFTVTKTGITFESQNAANVIIAAPAGTTAGAMIKVSQGAARGIAEKTTIFKRYGASPATYTGTFTLDHANIASTDGTGSNPTDKDVDIYNSSYVKLSGLSIVNSIGYGVTIGNTAGGAVSDHVTIESSTIDHNLMNGIRENDGSTNSFINNTITNNGHDNNQFNGDGILMQGQGATVSGNTINDNGGDTTFEHGIYIANTARGYIVTSNSFARNAASGVKADGEGEVSYNTINDCPRGIVLAENTATGVNLHHNTIGGQYLYGVFVTNGTTGNGGGHVWENTFAGPAYTGTLGTSPSYLLVNWVNVLTVDHNHFTGVRKYTYNVSSNVTNQTGFSASDNNGFNLGQFVWPALAAGTMTFATWKTKSGYDGASTCTGGTGC